MNSKRFFLAAILLWIGSFSFTNAQTGKESGTPFGQGEDSLKCRQNISLFTSYAKGKNYNDAYEFWKQALDECPASSKNIYFYGAQILNWKIQQEQDPANKQEWIEQLLNLYDLRAQYFGNDAKNGKDWIMAAKVADYLRLKGNDVDYGKIYDWVKPVVEEKGKEADPQAVYFFVFSSLNKAIGNEAWHEQYVNDYMAGNAILESSVDKFSAAPEDSLKLNNVLAFKGQLDELFAQSGLADCKMLTQIYGARLEENKSNSEFLQAMLDMFRYAGCDQDPMYFVASKYMYAIKPTAAAALGLAKEAMDNHKNAEATKYLTDAIGLTSDKRLKAYCYYSLAVISMNARNYSQARSYCNNALTENPNMGTPLILIAQMYAATAGSIYPDDAVKQRSVYYLAIDKLERARSIDKDPKVQAEAGRLIATYRKYLPSSQDVFFHPEVKQGSSFFVGGWIGESTHIR